MFSRIEVKFEGKRVYFSSKEEFFFWGLPSITSKNFPKEFRYQKIVNKFFCNICWKFATIFIHWGKGFLKKNIFLIFHDSFCAFWVFIKQKKSKKWRKNNKMKIFFLFSKWYVKTSLKCFFSRKIDKNRKNTF